MSFATVQTHAVPGDSAVAPGSDVQTETESRSEIVNPVECRALVPLAAAAMHRSTARVRANSTYLALLIAHEQRLPQTRDRRRLAPELGAAIYGEAAGLPLRPVPSLVRQI
jgi:hypothetical protein